MINGPPAIPKFTRADILAEMDRHKMRSDFFHRFAGLDETPESRLVSGDAGGGVVLILNPCSAAVLTTALHRGSTLTDVGYLLRGEGSRVLVLLGEECGTASGGCLLESQAGLEKARGKNKVMTQPNTAKDEVGHSQVGRRYTEKGVHLPIHSAIRSGLGALAERSKGSKQQGPSTPLTPS